MHWVDNLYLSAMYMTKQFFFDDVDFLIRVIKILLCTFFGDTVYIHCICMCDPKWFEWHFSGRLTSNTRCRLLIEFID